MVPVVCGDDCPTQFTRENVIAMQIDTDIAVWAGSAVLSAGIAFGIVKGKLYNYMTYEKHRDICAAERKQTTEVLEKLFSAQKEEHGMIKEIHGYIKAKNGGTL